MMDRTFLPEGWIEVPNGSTTVLIDAREVVAMRYHKYTFGSGVAEHHVEITLAGASGACGAVVADEEAFRNLCHKVWGAGA